MEPGEDIALIRLSKSGERKPQTIHIVSTIRKKDFIDLIQRFEPKVALLDYDGTFTRIGRIYSHTGKGETYQTGWQELRKRLPPEGHRALDRHYSLYKRGDITPLEWLYISIACYQHHGLTLNDIIETAGRVPFREGYEKFISLLKLYFEKQCILSFGLQEWIDNRPEFTTFPHETIASNVLVDKEGRINGVRAGITEETKGIAAQAILEKTGWSKMSAMAIGNSWHDRHLFSSAGISVYLSHGGYKGSGIDHSAEIERLKGIATIIIFDDTLCGVNDLIEKIVTKSF